jgi:hypothetical protein
MKSCFVLQSSFCGAVYMYPWQPARKPVFAAKQFSDEMAHGSYAHLGLHERIYVDLDKLKFWNQVCVPFTVSLTDHTPHQVRGLSSWNSARRSFSRSCTYMPSDNDNDNEHIIILWVLASKTWRHWTFYFCRRGFGWVVSVIVPLMLAVLPYARGHGFDSRSDLLDVQVNVYMYLKIWRWPGH